VTGPASTRPIGVSWRRSGASRLWRPGLWKLLGLAGLAGVAATGVVAVRAERRRRSYTPEQVRARLHERAAAARNGSSGR
jgi:hypothetical protein